MTPIAFDIAIGFLILLSTAVACYRGIIKEMFTIGGFAAAVLASYKGGYLLLPEINKMLNVTEGKAVEKTALIWGILSPALMAKVIAYGGMFIVVFFVALLLGFIISNWVKESGIGVLDRLLGATFGFLRGFLLVFLVYVPCVYLVDVKKFPEWVTKSYSMPVLQSTLDWANNKVHLDKMIEDRGNGIAIKLNKVDVDKLGEEEKKEGGLFSAVDELKNKIMQEDKEVQKAAPEPTPAPAPVPPVEETAPAPTPAPVINPSGNDGWNTPEPLHTLPPSLNTPSTPTAP